MDMNINLIIVCSPSISASLAVFFQLAMQGSTLTLGLILIYTGLTGKPLETYKLYMMCVGAVVTHFNCTNGTVCAGDQVECICSTNSGALDWKISERDDNNGTWILLFTVNFNKFSNNKTNRNGYNFDFNKTLNTSTLTFTLNQSEAILIECANGAETDKENATITDSG